MTSSTPNKIRFRYPFDGMTASDLQELFFVEFDTGISDRRILQSIDAAIWKRCDAGIRFLKKINDDCDKFGFPDCTRSSEDDILEYQKRELVYSHKTVEYAIKSIHRKELLKKTPRERCQFIHQAAVLADKERMDSKPGHYYPMCKENENYPSAKKRPTIDEAELKHNEEIKRIEKIAIKEMEKQNEKEQTEKVETVSVVSVVTDSNTKTNGDVTKNKKTWFSVFDYIA